MSAKLREFVQGGEMTEAEAEAYERNHLGSRHRLVVYETGIFQGRPYPFPDDLMPWAAPPYRFVTRLIVSAERSLEPEE
ncbi:MAG: hypothetical protein ACREIA_01165 [Opitutaceae bacterium]